MADPYVPDVIREFIIKRIDSIVQIEALLLIRSNPQEEWSAAQIAARVYVSEAEAADALERLCAADLLRSNDGKYRLDGISPQHAALIDQLLTVYKRHLIPVTNIVHSKSRRIDSFADAFIFRKGP
jgi:hypothetical protein